MKKFTSNLSIKLISLFLAIGIWVSIMYVIDPVKGGEKNLRLEVKNADYITGNKSYTMLDSGNIKISYKTKTKNLDQIKEDDFKAYIDLRDLASGNSLIVYCDFLNKVDEKISDILIEPKTIRVIIEEKTPKIYDIKYDLKGKLAAGRTVGNVILSQDAISISGTKEAMSKIDHVGIDIDLSKANTDETFSDVSKVNIYDANGEIISNPDLEYVNEIGFSVLIYSSVSVQVNASVIGTPEYGYKFLETKVDPNIVMVEGPASFLKNYYVVDLAPISVDGLTESKEFVLKLANFLPVGVKSKVEDIKVTAIIADNIIADQMVDKVGPHMDSDASRKETIEPSETNESDLEKASEEESSTPKEEIIESSVAIEN